MYFLVFAIEHFGITVGFHGSRVFLKNESHMERNNKLMWET